ncbi:MAG: glycoside hydrolase [Firmicutes bacterium]|nr:glycoside hydrolase [Bacillota bacterium]
MRARTALTVVAFAVILLASSQVALGAPAAGVIKQGSSGPAVVTLQRLLSEKGYYSGRADGVFGPGTKASVLAFQRDAGLRADGIAGPATLQALRKAEPSRAARSGAPGLVERFVEVARQFLGTRYVWGGTTPRGFDCSGFVYHVLNAAGIRISRSIVEQFATGAPVPRSALQAGDLVFFSTYKPGPSHVGIYLGDGTFIHASSARKKVSITPIDKQFYVKNWVGARRVT